MSRPTMRAWVVLGASNACMDLMPASRGQLVGGGTCLCAAASLPSSPFLTDDSSGARYVG